MDRSSWSHQDLIRACLEGHASAWEEFVRRVHPVIAVTVARTAGRCGRATRQLVDDLVQDAFVKICDRDYRVLREFEPRGPDSIFGLMRTVAYSVSVDYFRGRRSRPEQPLVVDGANILPGQDLRPGIERNILLREVDESLPAGISARDRQIFWFRYRTG